MFKFFYKRIDNKVIDVIIEDSKYRSYFIGSPGDMGAMGAPGPGADLLFKMWKEEYNKPHARVEEFLEWFKIVLKEKKE